MSRWRALLVLLLLALPMVLPMAHATEPTSGFTNPKEDAHYHALLKNLRCLVCQDESLQSSQAGLAQDLRREVREQMREGKSDKEIIHYLVDRYGDFVLFRPPLMDTTFLLWFGPFLGLLSGLLIAFFLVRARARAGQSASLQQAQHERLAELLGRDEDRNK
ncbi:MAG: hypothetical protein B7Z66_04635 [Chromatiales bacterium 21-64-14]|nr:MAG: hypothetical protein B7Z66_04635 [Chromatiales bacterium 21-64-14]HQU14616.1 cytochrome c-type biogenesis protein CcmH [Gammaproteobacteria bacterium]